MNPRPRQLDYGMAFEASMKLTWQSLWTGIGVFLIIGLPIGVLYLGIVWCFYFPMPEDFFSPSGIFIFLFAHVLLMFTIVLIKGVLVLLVGARYTGQHFPLFSAIAYALRMSFFMLMAEAPVSVLMFINSPWVKSVGYVVYLYLYLVTPIVLYEKVGPITAMKRSCEMMRGERLNIFFLSLSMMVLLCLFWGGAVLIYYVEVSLYFPLISIMCFFLGFIFLITYASVLSNIYYLNLVWSEEEELLGGYEPREEGDACPPSEFL